MPYVRSPLSRVIRYAVILVVAVVCVYGVYCLLWCWWHPVTTVVVVRHAEKSAIGGADPPLSTAGQVRAQALLHALGEAGVTAVYATEFIRTQQTVEPVAGGAGLTVIEYAASDSEELADAIRSDHAGGVVLVAGHGNTVTTIIEELGGEPVGLIAEPDYDNLFMVTVCRCSGSSVLHMKYGDPT